MYRELDIIVLTEDIPQDGLEQYDVGTIVHVFPGGSAYIVEFTTPDGTTVAITEVLPLQMRPVSQTDIAHARTIGSSA